MEKLHKDLKGYEFWELNHEKLWIWDKGYKTLYI